MEIVGNATRRRLGSALLYVIRHLLYWMVLVGRVHPNVERVRLLRFVLRVLRGTYCGTIFVVNLVMKAVIYAQNRTQQFVNVVLQDTLYKKTKLVQLTWAVTLTKHAQSALPAGAFQTRPASHVPPPTATNAPTTTHQHAQNATHNITSPTTASVNYAAKIASSAHNQTIANNARQGITFLKAYHLLIVQNVTKCVKHAMIIVTLVSVVNKVMSWLLMTSV